MAKYYIPLEDSEKHKLEYEVSEMMIVKGVLMKEFPTTGAPEDVERVFFYL